MDISEDVLRNTLAQIHQKDISDAGKKLKQETAAFDVVRNQEEQLEQINIGNIIERTLINILLVYGNFTEDFEDELVVLDEDDQNEYKAKLKVYDKVFLSLQEDEIDFANQNFNELFKEIIQFYRNNDESEYNNILNHLPQNLSDVATDIVMEEERHHLDNWESQHIYVKTKDQTVSQYVSQNILTLRLKLISDIVLEKLNHFDGINTDDETKEEINLYNGLRTKIAKKLGNVVKPFY
jgi:DNA primase